MSDLTKYQTDHLILLVGSNPLPNWVAAQMLCPTGTLHLVHSKDTEKVIIPLTEQLRQNNYEPYTLHEAETSPQKVYQKIKAILKKIPSGATVGLNYTGGTKVMSVHAYRAVLASRREVVCSYLDADTFELVIVGLDEEADEYIPTKVEISVDRLMRLHDIKLSKPPKKAPRLEVVGNQSATNILHEKIFQVLVAIHAEANTAQAWREWCQSELRRANEARNWIIDDKEQRLEQRHSWQETVERGSKWKSEGQLKLAQLPQTPDLVKVQNIFDDTFGKTGTLEKLGNVSGFAKKIGDFAKWFDGEWLEEYVLWTLTQLKESCQFNDLGMDYERDAPRFQFDVALTRGYQLFAFSCTTDDRKDLCKLKLFEAYIRARQMGGDEAKTVLVCCHDKPQDLEAEMSQEFGAGNKIKVFGQFDLPKLKEQLRTWFNQVEQSQRSRQ